MNEESSEQAGALAPETAFELLSHSRRLGLLECLKDHDETLGLTDASEAVASAVEDKPVQEIEADTVKQISMALYHSHIPRLEEHGIVDYDQERDLVRLTDRGHQLAEYMNRFKDSY